VGWNESAWLDRFSTLLSQGASILDIGCGSGEPIARYLIDRGFAVDGVDVSNVGNLRATHRHEQEMESSGQQEH
jgi:cyclopropane fatty-acyl-phospholipid synthase-like methyltransferase